MLQGNISRRMFLGSTAALLGGLIPVSKFRADTINHSRRPNVILIYTDDQGSIDMNCYGAKDLYTPNLDQLAAQGTRFTQFYVGAPVCSPSRAALMTGRYPQRAQLAGNTSSMHGVAGMPGKQVTMAEMLKGAGYVTGHVGKWHLGYTPDTMPNGQGFDYSFGHMGGCIDNYSHFFYWAGPNRHDLWQNGKEVWRDGEFFGDLVVEESGRFIETNRDKPFFLYCAINMPHYPLQGKDKFRKMYEKVDEPRRSYAAFVSTVDDMVGRIVNKVDSLGIRNNTVIIYCSDHGHSVEERTNYGGGDSGPYRGHKFTVWEGGIRVPCIVSWPGTIGQGQVRSQMAINMDWMATLSHWCGGKIEHKIDGKDISGIIADPDVPSPHEMLLWHRPHRDPKKAQAAVRRGKWKLVLNGPATRDRHLDLPGAKVFLSDMTRDVTETKNLAGQYPEVVRQLQDIHDKWIEEVQVQ